MPHVVDSARLWQIAEADKTRLRQHQTAEAARQETRHANLVGTICDPAHQMGTRLTTEQFITKLRKLNKNLVLEPSTQRPDTDWLFLVIGDNKIHLSSFEKDWLPEWSIMGVTTARRPADTDSGVWVKTKIPDVEIRRGWRTVLLRLIMKRVITLDAAEREFGVADRASWAALKQSVLGLI